MFIRLILFNLILVQSAFAATSYEVEKSVNDETFIINGEVFKARTYCFNVNDGDRVIFLSGSPYGACAMAEFLDLRTKKTCKVWCE